MKIHGSHERSTIQSHPPYVNKALSGIVRRFKIKKYENPGIRKKI